MKWKMLALDLDGTTLNSQEEISPTNLTAIGRASRAGVKIIVTTGRSYSSALRFIRQLDTGDPSITYNGALIRNGRSILRHLTMADGAVRDTLALLKELGQSPVVYTADEKRYLDDPEKLIRGFFEFSKGSEIENHRVDDLLVQEWNQVIRISVFTDETSARMLDDLLIEKLGGSIKTAQTYFPEWDFWILEVLNPGCSKTNALQFLCDRYGFYSSEVVAVGDNRNDIDMFSWAGLGVAMKNSRPDVAQHADRVTVRDNNNAGVAEVIEEFIL
jgi:Cof subfamily protein (haloacid dehalogenase superfamily)